MNGARLHHDPAAFLANVMDLLVDAVCVVDAEGRFVFVSAACERIFGYAAAELVGRPMLDLVFPEDRERTLHAVGEIVAGQPNPGFENRYVHKDGRIIHIMWSARWSPENQVRVAVARDITERKRAEAVQAALYAISEAAHAAGDLLALFSHVHRIIDALLPAKNFFIALYDEANGGLSFPYHVDERAPAPADAPLAAGLLSADVVRTGRTVLFSHDAADAYQASGRPDVGADVRQWLGVPLDAQAGVIGALVVKSYTDDIRYADRDVELLQFVSIQVAAAVGRKQTESRLQHMARHDALTDLPNRELFHDRLLAAITRARREREPLALLYLDLDDFKQVNDRLGHANGDALLREVSRRLAHCVRESDTVGRIGGDEFVVLLNGLHQVDDALRVADKVRVAIGEALPLAGEIVRVSPSIGIALFPLHGDEPAQLLRQADEAMYRAKRQGGNGVQLAPADRSNPSSGQ